MAVEKLALGQAAVAVTVSVGVYTIRGPTVDADVALQAVDRRSTKHSTRDKTGWSFMIPRAWPRPKRVMAIAALYCSSSMHFANTSRLGRVTDSGKVASGWSVIFNRSTKLGA